MGWFDRLLVRLTIASPRFFIRWVSNRYIAGTTTTDAIKAIELPVIEVHLSDPATREAFRHISYVGMGAVDEVKGLGARGYAVALEKAAAL